VPLEGRGLKAASGPCPNPLYAPADALSAASADGLPTPEVYEYDIVTKPGKTYKIKKSI
jgi:alpha-L-fucosidase 2